LRKKIDKTIRELNIKNDKENKHFKKKGDTKETRKGKLILSTGYPQVIHRSAKNRVRGYKTGR